MKRFFRPHQTLFHRVWASYGKIREWRQHDPANGEGPSHADEETEAWHKRSCCYPFEMLTGWRW